MTKTTAIRATALRAGDRLANGSVVRDLRVGAYAVTVLLTSAETVSFDVDDRVKVWR